jgi:hypothetical protein
MTLPRRFEVTGAWRNWGNIIRVNELRRMRWTRHVAGTTEMKDAYTIYSKSLNRSEHLGDLGMDGMMMMMIKVKSKVSVF